VLRCSGNTNDRQATTFARRRNITYKIANGPTYNFPVLGSTPLEGGHVGNLVTAILNNTGKIPQDVPPNWNAHNGVSWKTAAIEVLAAEAATYTQLAQTGRFSRQVGQLVFTAD
jgi:hypothetical protein